MSSREYKLEVMICLWLAIELERLEEARLIFTMDPIIDKILASIREKGAAELKEQRKAEE